MKIKRWFTYNWGYKILAAILAIVTWFYVSGEIRKMKAVEDSGGASRLYYQR